MRASRWVALVAAALLAGGLLGFVVSLLRPRRYAGGARATPDEAPLATP